MPLKILIARNLRAWLNDGPRGYQALVSVRHAVAAFGAARAVFGLGYVLAPGRGGKGWVGEPATEPVGRLSFRSIGARDIALGAGAALAALRQDDAGAVTWLTAHVVADSADCAGSLIASGEIPDRGRNLGAAIAGASAVVAAGLAIALAIGERD